MGALNSRVLLKVALFLTVGGTVLSVPAISLGQSARELMNQAQTAYNNKEYAKSAELYRQAYKVDDGQIIALYNAACSYALAGQKEEAFKALDELVAKGYNEPAALKSDTDFTTLRDAPRWSSILAKAEDNAKKNPPRPRWQKPYKILDDSGDVASLQKLLGDEKSLVWLEGDILTFLHKSSSKTVQLTGGVQEPMKQIPNTDLWILRLQMSGWEKAIITYSFIESDSAVVPLSKLNTWSGPQAPALSKKAAVLQGQVIERSYHSAALNEDRKLHIYLPPNAPTHDLPAVFMADGEGCKSFAQVLEPLILSGQVRPCAIVGVDNGGYRGDRQSGYDSDKDFRAKEYVPGDDPERFDHHMTFFTDEVGAYVAKEFGISQKREDRAVTGFSNGGAFSAAVAFRRPDFFGTSMPLSLGVPPTDSKPSTPLPHMHFAAGSLESFSRATGIVFDLVKSWGVDSTYDIYVAGHDPAMWELAFANLMPKVFPGFRN